MAQPIRLPDKYLEYSHARYPLGFIIKNLNNGNLRLYPEYRMWKEVEEQDLLHLLLQGIPIPEITIQGSIFSLATCVGGHSRLITLQKFVKGELVYKPTYNGMELDFTELDKEEQQRFLDSVIVTVRTLEGIEWYHSDTVECFVHEINH
jgi:hypothetical protein